MQISADVAKVLALPKARGRLMAIGAGSERARRLRRVRGHDIKTWIKLAQRTGIKLSPCRAAAQAK
jgi:hypothetical protein